MTPTNRPRVMHSLHATGIGLALGILALAPALARSDAQAPWTAEERTVLRSLSLSSLAPLPSDRSNKYGDNPAASRLGNQLFNDPRLSSDGRVSCATCHVAEKGFQDDIPLGKGVGTAGRRTMPIAGTAHSPWQFWDGRADSHWAQALGPLESAVEHGGDRLQYVRIIQQHYRREYEALFGALPDLQGLPERAGPVADSARANAWARIAPARRDSISRVYANMGKAIAAFERQVAFTPTRFDRYVDAELAGRAALPGDTFSADERAGLRLFIGKANCVNCHNGPLLTDNHFHNTGVPQSRDGTAADSGRATGVRAVMASEFNCLSHYSDAKPSDCSELRFAVTEGEELVRAYKTPSLRNAVLRAPFMHAGQLASIQMVLLHYNRAPKAPAGHSELKRLGLSGTEVRQLGAFLHTLVSPVAFPAPVASYTP
ncbi:MAG: cytochrome c peroxidase [Gemmatimonadales bacterium]|nr:cytochrome c peroxidase [Gemmatimonadales bacterium]